MSFRLSKFILIVCFWVMTDLRGQLPRSAFSVQLGGTFSVAVLKPHNTLHVGTQISQFINPRLNYNFLIGEHQILETGIELYNLGNKINYYDQAGKIVNSVDNSNQVVAVPATFFTHFSKRYPNRYLGLGAMPAYNFTGTVFQNITPDYIETTTHLKGFKLNLTGSVRTIFVVKKRYFCLDLRYSQGLMKYYQTDIVFFNGRPDCKIIHRGSSLQFGLSYFFLRKKTEE